MGILGILTAPQESAHWIPAATYPCLQAFPDVSCFRNRVRITYRKKLLFVTCEVRSGKGAAGASNPPFLKLWKQVKE